MTVRQVFEYVLVEINKVKASSMLVEDFNYLFNKAVYQFVNKVYNVYDINQQTSDELRVLKSTAVLKPTKRTDSTSKLYGSFYETVLPSDYYHMLNCICEFTPNKNFKCYNANVPVYFAARRLTSDMWSQIINNFYMRPMYKRPYYFIHNNNKLNNPFGSGVLLYLTSKEDLPTNPYEKNTIGTGLGSGTDQNGNYTVPSYTEDGNLITSSSITNSNLSRTINVNGKELSVVKQEIGVRYGNSSDIRIEIRYGTDDALFKLGEIHVDYLKVPLNIKLTQDQLDLVEDTSQIIEFPDYVCYEIINELVKLLLENSSDPRLNTNIPVNQSIAPPAQATQQQPQ